MEKRKRVACPGGAATEVVRSNLNLPWQVRGSRDLVSVDQRGTSGQACAEADPATP